MLPWLADVEWHQRCEDHEVLAGRREGRIDERRHAQPHAARTVREQVPVGVVVVPVTMNEDLVRQPELRDVERRRGEDREGGNRWLHPLETFGVAGGDVLEPDEILEGAP